MAGSDMGEKTTEQLGDELTELAAHLAAATHRWLRLLAEFDRREGWAGIGVRSCAHWVSWQCGIDLPTAREKVRVARALGELPLIGAALSRGELSYSMTRALTRVATPDSEAELLELARHGTVSQVERLVRALRRATEADLVDDARRQHERRHLDLLPDDDGGATVRGRLPAEGAAVVDAALRAAAEDASADAPDGYPARLADALVLMAEAYLAQRERADGPSERYQLVITAEAAALAADEGGCHLPDGTAVPAETARRLGCDANVVGLVHDADGRPLQVGRRSRRVPPRLRRALHHRDRGCRFPGCSNRHWVDAHHIQHWAHGGATELDNLVLLCRRHHTLVHEGGYAFEADGTVRQPDGRPLPHVPPRPAGHAHQARASTPVSADTIRTRWSGEPLDLDLALTGLLAAS